MARHSQYRRVVVTVREGTAPALRLAAELAQLLELELEGVFVEDEALLTLAALPFARELRLPGHTWQALDPARMLEDFQQAAERARQLLADAAARLGIASGFSVLRGDPAAAAMRSGAGDILVLAASGSAHLPGMLPSAGEAAWHAHAGIMLVPPRIADRRGAIALAVAAASQVGLEIAAAIASRTAEGLLLIVPEQGIQPGAAEATLREAGFPSSRIQRRRVWRLDAAEIAAVVRAGGARLLVLDRAGLPDNAPGFLARLMTEMGVPVLVVGEETDAPKTGG
jgi:hypothetical protein